MIGHYLPNKAKTCYTTLFGNFRVTKHSLYIYHESCMIRIQAGPGELIQVHPIASFICYLSRVSVYIMYSTEEKDWWCTVPCTEYSSPLFEYTKHLSITCFYGNHTIDSTSSVITFAPWLLLSSRTTPAPLLIHAHVPATLPLGPFNFN
jgi:hypothetical protein